MNLNKNNMRALKGYLYNGILNSKALYIVTASIFISRALLLTGIFIAMALTGQNEFSSNGALTNGFAVSIICMFIAAITLAAGKHLRASFVFPINRKMYTIGSFILITINTVILLLMSSAAFLFESIINKLTASILDTFVYVNPVTTEAFLTGFWISLCYILATTTLTYLVFMLFSRYKLKAIVAFVLFINIIFLFSFGISLYHSILKFFIAEQSIALLSLKLLAFAVLFHCLSYLPLKSMEVNR